ncbi:MAG: amidase [Kineosporiaceae bacterium]|nr:amidase [Kineosporiaceae bacterium]
MLIDEDEYRAWDGVELARLVRAGEVSATDLTETALGLLEARSDLNALAYRVDPVGQPATAGVFAGVPFAVKELLAWPGLPWTMGSRLLANNPAPGLSPYAERLRDAGLTVLASTTSSEFGLLGSTETALHGITRNPWRAGASAGGSSGGSAVLVAAGVVPMAHGSDAGGSLRVPAALNGIVGFKPSGGRCLPTGPQASGLQALVTDHVMTRSVRDSAQLLAVTERTGPDAVHAPIGVIDGPSPARLRIGVLASTLTGREPDAVVRRELDRVAARCAALGHEVELAVAPGIDGAGLSRGFFTAAALTMTMMAQLTTSMRGFPPVEGEVEPFTLELIEWAKTLGPQAQSDSEQALADAARTYLTLFDRYDVVLSPTLAVASWPIGYLDPGAGRDVLIDRTERVVGYTPIHNPAGCPAMTLPLGWDDGLPIGLHFAAAPGADALLLGLAYELEQAAPWADRRPGR